MNAEIKTNWMELIKAKLNLCSNYKWQIIKYSLYIISSIYTILLFRSQAHSDFSKNLQSVCGAVIELAKYELPVIAIVGAVSTKRVHWGLRVLALALALPCFYYSIKATAGFQLLEYRELKDKGFEATEDYKRLKSELDDKRAQRKTVMDNQSKSIDLDKTSNTKNNDMANQLHNDVEVYQKKINSKNAELQQAINRNSKKPCPSTISRLKLELKQLESNLNNTFKQLQGIKPSDAIIINSKSIEALNNDIKDLNKKIDDLKKNYTAEGGYGILFGTQTEFDDFINNLALLIELVGIFAAIMVGQQNKTKKVRKITTVYYEDDGSAQGYYNSIGTHSPGPQLNNATAGVLTSKADNIDIEKSSSGMSYGKSDFVPYHEEEIASPPLKNKIGFVSDPAHSSPPEIIQSDYDNADLEQYIEYMYHGDGKKSIGDLSPGYDKFRAFTNLGPKKIKGIRYHLEKTGVIKIQGKTTTILVNQIQALKLSKL